MLHLNALIAQEIAESLGAVVIPVSRCKKPLYRFWRRLNHAGCLTKEMLELYSEETNIAIVQGSPSSGLISIDFDEPEALEEFLTLNSGLRNTLTTSAARGANLWFKMQGDYPKLTRLKRGRSIWAEWRSTGGFTVIHGTHKKGMPYTSNEKTPLKINILDIVLPEDVIFKASKGSDSSEHLNATPASTPLHTALCTSAPLHNIESSKDKSVKQISNRKRKETIITDQSKLISPALILGQIKNREETLEALNKENPTLHKLYLKFIERNFTAMPHQRNAFLNEAIPFLYRAVTPNLIKPLIEVFYIVHRPIFRDPLSQHMKEAEALLEGVSETYFDSLPQDEQKLILALTEREQWAYRILRDLAMRVSDESPERIFFMSADEMGMRLGISSIQGHRILKGKLTKLGIIEVIENGVRRSRGQRGIATTYRWNVATL